MEENPKRRDLIKKMGGGAAAIGISGCIQGVSSKDPEADIEPVNEDGRDKNVKQCLKNKGVWDKFVKHCRTCRPEKMKKSDLRTYECLACMSQVLAPLSQRRPVLYKRTVRSLHDCFDGKILSEFNDILNNYFHGGSCRTHSSRVKCSEIKKVIKDIQRARTEENETYSLEV